MALLGDRVQETTTSTGTGSITLNGAVTGYVTFNSTFSNGNSVWYVIDDGAGNWEIGYGTVGTGTLTRTVFQSSNANALVPFGVGTKRVFCTAPYTYLLPDQTGNSGKILTTDGTTSSWTTIASAGGVTSVSVASANGFAGTSSGGSTPALTLSTSISGILKGNGTAISAAVAGTDYAAANASFTLGSTSVSLGGTTTTVAGLTLTNPTINGFTGDTSVVNIGSGQFYKDTSGNVGIGTSSPGVKLDVNGGISLGASNNLTWGGVYGANIPTIAGSSTNGFTFYPTGSTGGERMRLDSSGNLGIGTSSPGQKLEVSGSAYITGGVGGQGCYLTRNGSDGGAVYSAQVGSIQIAAPSTNPITFVTNSTEKMRLDSSGNLGLGVTPHTWGSNYKAIELVGGSAGVVSAYVNDLVIGTNIRNDNTNWIYTYTGQNATRYQMTYTGQHQWYTAPSGTAGSTITFTQAMTLFASGCLAVGGTTDLGAGVLNVGSGTSQTAISGRNIGFYNTGVANATIKCSDDASTFTSASLNKLLWAWYTNDTERARIDSSGNLLVGTTNSTPAQSNVSGFKVGGGQIECNGTNTQAAFFGRSNDGQVVRFFNAGSGAGNISNTGTTTSYNGTSDYRLKDNIQPMVGALEKVSQLKPCTFVWKLDGRNGQGFIAHELQEVIPDAVVGTKDEVNANGEPEYQSIDPRMVVATLAAAIQELTARIEQLEAR